MAVLFAGALSAYGQGVQFGVKGGVDLTELKLSSVIDEAQPKNRVGWFIGPTLGIGLPLGFGVDISALYNQRESDIEVYYESASGDQKKTDKLKTKQIIVPLNVRYDIGLGSVATVFGFAGPQIAFRIGDSTQNLTDWKNEVMEWRLNSSNFSVNVGFGIVVSNLQLSANYNVGVGKTGEVTWRTASDAVVEGFKGRYNSWQIALAYYF